MECNWISFMRLVYRSFVDDELNLDVANSNEEEYASFFLAVLIFSF